MDYVILGVVGRMNNTEVRCTMYSSNMTLWGGFTVYGYTMGTLRVGTGMFEVSLL